MSIPNPGHLGLSACHLHVPNPSSSPDSIKQAASQVAEDLLSFYHGDEPGQVPGILPGPPPNGDYYWWQGGAMWGALLDYRAHTGDMSYDDMVTTAMLFQVGDDKDFMPRNWSASMGNDDQAFWALSALVAAETGFTDPAATDPQWLPLAQAVFNEQTHEDRRAPSGNCDWGLRWQVYPSNNGYDYINSTCKVRDSFWYDRMWRLTFTNSYCECLLLQHRCPFGKIHGQRHIYGSSKPNLRCDPEARLCGCGMECLRWCSLT